MRILQIKPYLTDKELKAIMNKQKAVSAFRDYQIIYSVQTNFGKKAEDIAKGLGLSTNKVCSAVNDILECKETIKALTGFPWILNTILGNMIAG